MMPYTTNNNNNNSCHNGFVGVGREKNGSLDFHMGEFQCSQQTVSFSSHRANYSSTFFVSLLLKREMALLQSV